MSTMESLRHDFARDADLFIEAMGEVKRPVNYRDYPIRAKEFKRIEPSQKGFSQIPDIIQKKFLEFMKENPDADPQSFEVDFVSSNHGQMEPNQSNLAKFGISTNDPKGDKTITEEMLTSFGAALPKGIRLRAISGQCYGSNTSKALFRGFEKENDASCGCRGDLAAPNHTSFSGQGNVDYEKFVTRYSAEHNISLAAASWLAMRVVSLGESNFYKLEKICSRDLRQATSTKIDFSSECFQEILSKSINSASLGSEAIVQDFFHASGDRSDSKEQMFLSRIKIEELSQSSKNKNKEFSVFAQSMAERRRIIAKILNIPADSPEFYEALRSVVSTQVETKGRLSTHLRNRYKDAVQDQKTARGSFEIKRRREERALNKLVAASMDNSLQTRSTVASLLAREQMEKEFLEKAPENLRKKFLAARQCELELFGPGPVETLEEAVPTRISPNPPSSSGKHKGN